MVKGIGFLAGALFTVGIVTLLSVGMFLLPLGALALGGGAVWAHRHGKAKAFWMGSTIGAAAVFISALLMARVGA